MVRGDGSWDEEWLGRPWRAGRAPAWETGSCWSCWDATPPAGKLQTQTLPLALAELWLLGAMAQGKRKGEPWLLFLPWLAAFANSPYPEPAWPAPGPRKGHLCPSRPWAAKGRVLQPHPALFQGWKDSWPKDPAAEICQHSVFLWLGETTGRSSVLGRAIRARCQTADVASWLSAVSWAGLIL